MLKCKSFNRSHFYKIGSPEILQLFDGMDRIINKKDPHKLHTDTGQTGLRSIHKLHYTIERTSTNENDNLYQGMPNNFGYININTFLSETRFEDDEYYKYDLREPIAKISNPEPKRRTMNVNTTTEDWTNIPYYPTIQDRKDASLRRQLQPQQQPQQPQPPRTPPPQQIFLRQPQSVNIFSQNYTNKIRAKGGGGGQLQNTNTHLGVARR